MFAMGVGMATQFIGLQAAAYATIPSAKNGHASAIYATQGRIGSALSVAILGTVLSAASDHRILASVHAFHIAFAVDAAIAVVGAVAAIRIRDVDAARTMTRHQRVARSGNGGIAEHSTT